MKLKILVGTMTSTADYVAQAIEMDCADLVDEVEIVMMDGQDIAVFDEDALYLICSSTYGSGDVPDNARALYESLDANALIGLHGTMRQPRLPLSRGRGRAAGGEGQ